MSTRRMAKVNEAIRESVATEVLFGLKDPRIKNVTVLHAEVSPDLRTAKVYVSVMGDEKVQSLAMHGLRSACGYLQAKLADRLQTRYTPVLNIILDDSVKISAQTSALIDEAMRQTALTHVATEGTQTEGTQTEEAKTSNTSSPDAETSAEEDELVDALETEEVPDDDSGHGNTMR